MKSSEEWRCSYRSLSMERGWFQSKRSRGFALPRVAIFTRRARFRASRSRCSRVQSCSAICTGDAFVLAAWTSHASMASRDARMPILRRRSTMSVVSLIVASEVVGDDVALDDVVAELDGQRCGPGAAPPLLLAEDGHGAAVVDAAREHVGGDRAQGGGAVGVEHLDGEGDHRADVSARVDPALEEPVDLRDFHAQPVAALEIPGLPLVFEDRFA